MSRTKNSINNFITSAIGEVLTLLLNFITRMVFVRTLSTEFLGINGLFTNIISMLSLAELGIGTAITFNLYKPIATDDKKKILMLMNFYKSAYYVIGIVVALIGLLIIPFLPLIISDDINFVNVNLVFILYLLQTVSTYLFFAYKSSLMKAYQKEYMLTKIGYIFSVLGSLLQILVLILFKSFELYICVLTVTNILKNLAFARATEKKYPFIKEKIDCKLSKEEKKNIFSDCAAIFMYNINYVVLNSTDNLILSKYVGLKVVGLYSNYLLIYSAIRKILLTFFNSLIASLGNLNASGDIERQRFIFNIINMLTVSLFGIFSIGIYILADDFICLWLGSDYIISGYFSLLLAIEFYLYGYRKFLSLFRESMGLFQQSKYRPLIGIFVNLVISLLLVKPLGINGVLLGTIIADLTTVMWIDPIIICKNGLNIKPMHYFISNLKYFLIIAVCLIISRFLTINIIGVNIFTFVLKGIILVLISLVVLFLCFYKKEEFKHLLTIVKKIS